MRQIYPDAGLTGWMRNLTVGFFNYHLFVNDITIDKDTVPGDFVEASFTGYAPVQRGGSGFGYPGVAGNVGNAFADAAEFNNNSGIPQSVYGYFVMDVLNTYLLAAARFDNAPYVIESGDLLAVPVVFACSSKFLS